jgi:hypothetical protein
MIKLPVFPKLIFTVCSEVSDPAALNFMRRTGQEASLALGTGMGENIRGQGYSFLTVD